MLPDKTKNPNVTNSIFFWVIMKMPGFTTQSKEFPNVVAVRRDWHVSKRQQLTLGFGKGETIGTFECKPRMNERSKSVFITVKSVNLQTREEEDVDGLKDGMSACVAV
jgi:hypothetical protein